LRDTFDLRDEIIKEILLQHKTIGTRRISSFTVNWQIKDSQHDDSYIGDRLT